VTLVPYDAAAHGPALLAALHGAAYAGHPAYDAEALVWRYLGGVREQPAAALAWLASLRDAPDARCFTVLSAAPAVTPQGHPAAAAPSSGAAAAPHAAEAPAVIGTISLMRNAPEHLCVEIGWIAITPAYQASPATTEAASLLLRHAFGLGYQRVEWKCNSRNERSKAAAARLGFTYEGTFRAHQVAQGGHRRDTTWFSLLAGEEWAAASSRVGAWLASDAAAALADRRQAQLASLRAAAATTPAH
jgi:RimJ/RimL family protein N-acetyltransferase